MTTRIILDAPVTNDMLLWLSKHVEDWRSWTVESEYDSDADGNVTTDILRDHIIFINDRDATLFRLKFL
jgi:hypothetical protein